MKSNQKVRHVHVYQVQGEIDISVLNIVADTLSDAVEKAKAMGMGYVNKAEYFCTVHELKEGES